MNRVKIGQTPGEVLFTGEQKMEDVNIHHLLYSADTVEERHHINSLGDEMSQARTNMVNWLDMRGLHNEDLIIQLGTTYDVHPMILESIVDIGQRPLFEQHDGGIFMLLHAVQFNKKQNIIEREQVSFFLENGILLSFQESESDLFVNVRNRLMNNQGRVRRKGNDYLLFALMDEIVDRYHFLLEEFERRIEDLEDDLLSKPNENTKAKIHELKKQWITVRRLLFPLKEALIKFSKSDHPLIQKENQIYFKDLLDNHSQIIESLESSREMIDGLYDLFISEMSHHMNQIMKVLTIISVLFIPLTFLAGLYGMNFSHMPELKWDYGYPTILGVMVFMLVAQLIYFKKRHWF